MRAVPLGGRRGEAARRWDESASGSVSGAAAWCAWAHRRARVQPVGGGGGTELSSAQESAAVRRGRKEREKEGKGKRKGKKKKKKKKRKGKRERVAADFTAATTGLDEHARRSATRNALRGMRERKRWDGD